MTSKNLWSVEECLEHYNKESQQLQFVDASWFMGGDRDGRSEFEDGPRIPKSFYWDTDDMATSFHLFPEDNPGGLNHVFPPEWLVGAALEQMGIQSNPKTTLVVYGRKGTMFAPRAWLLLHRYYQHGDVKLLNGTLEEWIDKGGPVDETPLKRSITSGNLVQSTPIEQQQQAEHPLVASTAKDRLVHKNFVLNALESKSDDAGDDIPSVIIDTRGPVGFGNGHIPGSYHVPFSSLTTRTENYGACVLKSKEELESVLKTALGADVLEQLKSKPPLLTCGSAVSVCTLALALDELGICSDPWIYDGSWNEWGTDPNTPKETGSKD